MVGRHSQCWRSGCHHPVQCLDDAPGCDIPGVTVHDVQLLVALVVAGFRVRVVVDYLDRPLGVMELHLLLIVTLVSHLLLAFPLTGRHAVTMWLHLLLLAELLHELLNLSALLGIMALGLVHRAPRPTLVAAGELARSLVTAWAAAATAAAVGAPANGLLLLDFFFFLFLFLSLL
jgi:hypothetical protein